MYIRLGKTRIQIRSDGTQTVLHDKKVINACPHDTEEYHFKAQLLGYGDDTLSLCREHEIGHTLLAKFMRLPESLVMRALADNRPDSKLLGLEEDAVMAIQAFAREAGIDLVALACSYDETGHA